MVSNKIFAMSNVTLKMNITKYNQVKKGYKPFLVPSKGDYIDFIAKKDGIVITGYLSTHQTKKINFVGEKAEKEASRWDDNKPATSNNVESKKKDTPKKEKVLLSKDEYLKKEKENKKANKSNKKATATKKADKKKDKILLSKDEYLKKEKVTKKKDTKKSKTKKVEAKKATTKKEVKKVEAKNVETKKSKPKKVEIKKADNKKKKVLLTKDEYFAKESTNSKEASKAKTTTKKVMTNTKITLVKRTPTVEKNVINKPLISDTNNEKKTWVDYNDQIGSDEVGVGDFLGPIIVVATYVKKSDIKLLKELGVKDSKKLTDQKIREIAPILIRNLEFSKLTLSNERYNQLITSHENLNSIKAKLHNRALYNLVNKHPDTIGVYIDQFVTKEKFYEYLDNPEEPVVKDIAFSTKGESLYPSVAAASIIARYSYLLEMDNLNQIYKTVIPFGASKFVTEFARDFIAKYGVMELNKIAKRNFANYMEAISVKLV